MAETVSYFEILGEINYLYWHLRQLQASAAVNPTSSISKAIDHATGYAKAQTDLLFTQTIETIQEIIRLKKLIKHDTESDEEVLRKIQKVRK